SRATRSVTPPVSSRTATSKRSSGGAQTASGGGSRQFGVSIGQISVRRTILVAKTVNRKVLQGSVPCRNRSPTQFVWRTREKTDQCRSETVGVIRFYQRSVFSQHACNAADVAGDYRTAGEHRFNHREGHRFGAAGETENIGIP